MSLIAGATDSFKEELFRLIHDFAFDTFKIALYQDGSNIGPGTEVYTTSGEVTGTGYSAGGQALTVASIQSSQGVSYVDFSDVSWPGANFTARGALIYNSSKSNRSVLIMDFGVPRLFSSTSNTVVFPVPDRDNAILRIGYVRQ